MYKSKYQIKQWLLVGCLLLISCIRIMEKVNFHKDEIVNYGIANNYNSFVMTVNEGKKYVPSSQPFLNFVTVSEYNRFNYQNVYRNTANDVHPPLYFDLLHTICSLFPGTFSKWYAGFVNIVFIIGTFILIQKLLNILPFTNEHKSTKYIISIIFIFSKGISNSTVFLRMYVMAMFLCTGLTYILIKDILSEKEININIYISLFFITLFGALTHYYCIIFAVASCFIYGLILLKNKSFKKFLLLILTGIMSGISAYVLFPEMVQHMFTGYRGIESIENLNSSLQQSIIRYQQYDEIINIELFGGLSLYILAISICIIIFLCIKNNNKKGFIYDKKTAYFIDSYLIIFLPVIIYFIFVSKSSVFIVDRYMFPIYALLLTGVFSIYFTLINRLFSNHNNLAFYIQIITSIVVIFFNFSNPKYKEYLYKSTIPILENAKNHSDYDSLFIYDNSKIWNCYPSLLESTNYKSLTFVSNSNIDILPSLDIAQNNTLQVFVPNNETNVIEIIIETYPQFTIVDKNGSYTDYTSYFLSSD